MYICIYIYTYNKYMCTCICICIWIWICIIMYMYVYMYMHMYMHMYSLRIPSSITSRLVTCDRRHCSEGISMQNKGMMDARVSNYTVSSRTKNLDFRGFDSNIFLMLRAGSPRSIGSFPDI